MIHGSPATWNESRVSIPSSSPSAECTPFEIPTTDEQCENLLDALAMMIRGGRDPRFVAEQSARFLGASSCVWTTIRRVRLRRFLADLGVEGLRAAFEALVSSPRVEVFDSVESVLEERGTMETYLDLLNGKPIGLPGLAALVASPEAKIALVRVVSRSDLGEKATQTLARLLEDPSEDVRDAVVAGLAQRPSAREILERHRGRERSAFVRSAIDEALLACG